MTSREQHWVGEVVSTVLGGNGIYRATKYVTPTVVISAARQRYNKKIMRRERCPVVSLRIGKPNFAERDFIKKALRANEPFPIKKVQLKHELV